MAKKSLPEHKPFDNLVFIEIPDRGTFKNLRGLTFGRLTALGFAGMINHNAYWWCSCRCGQLCRVKGGNLACGHTLSCGCLRDDANRAALHGESKNHEVSAELRAFYAARKRCADTSDPYYGGRGIEFRFESFRQFLDDLGRRPSPDHSLDRKDVNGHYEPGNVRWATKLQQLRNKRNTKYLIINQVNKPLRIWAEEYGLDPQLVWLRVQRKWCDECSVLLPKGGTCPHR